MTRIAYTVTATLPDAPTAQQYVAWLQDGHIDAVIAGGAHSATLVLLDPESPGVPIRVEVRYIFSTREVFDRYLQHHAPTLRADGLQRFGATPGLTFSRSTGIVL